jgi:hypothetical protein
VRLGVTPDINAIATIIIALVSIGVVTPALVSRARFAPRRIDAHGEPALTGLDGVLASEQRRALPGVVYRDPAVYEAEIRRIFLGSWPASVTRPDLRPRRYFPFESPGSRDRRARCGRRRQRASTSAATAVAYRPPEGRGATGVPLPWLDLRPRRLAARRRQHGDGLDWSLGSRWLHARVLGLAFVNFADTRRRST